MLSAVRTTSTHCRLILGRLILGHTSAKTELHRIRGSRHHEQKRCGSGLESYRRRKSGIPAVPTIADTCRADTNRLIMECHEGAVPSHNKTTALVGVGVREHNPGRVSTLSQKASSRQCRSVVPSGRQKWCGETVTAHLIQNTTRESGESATLQTMQNEM